MHFLYMNVLFFMLIPALILFFIVAKKREKLSKYFSNKSLEKLKVSDQYFSNRARNITLLISLVLMIIALARPVINEKIHTPRNELNTLVIAVDISKSMLADDIKPNRLIFAKRKLLDIIDSSNNYAIAVVLFAKNSFILSPLTQDFTSLKTLINNLDTHLNFDNGTNIFSTLEATNKLLKDYKNKNLLLLTDGGENKTFKNEIQYAKKNNIDIYTIGVSTKNGSAIKLNNGNYLTDKNGNIVTVKLNEEIKELSLKTNGGYINYTLNNNDVNIILEDINRKSQKNKFNQKSFKTYTELFYYPLCLAILLLLIAFSSIPNIKKKVTNLSLFLLIFILNSNGEASITDFSTIKKANSAYQKGDFASATKEYEKLDNNTNEKEYNLANSLYKEGKYKQAITRYNNIKSQDRDLNFKKLHNLGNAYTKINDLNNALESYKEALKIKNDKETKENFEIVKEALNNKQKNKENNSSKKDNKKKEKNTNKSKNENHAKKNDNKKDISKNKEENEKKETNNENLKSNEISNKEELMWLKQLEQQKTNSLLKKLESSNNKDTNSTPW